MHILHHNHTITSLCKTIKRTHILTKKQESKIVTGRGGCCKTYSHVYKHTEFVKKHTWAVSRRPGAPYSRLHKPCRGPASSRPRCGCGRWSGPPRGPRWGWRGATPGWRQKGTAWRRTDPPPSWTPSSSSVAPGSWRGASLPGGSAPGHFQRETDSSDSEHRNTDGTTCYTFHTPNLYTA